MNTKINKSTLQWESTVRRVSLPFQLPPSLILAVIDMESEGNKNATGSAGEIGLMQLKNIAIVDVKENFPELKDIASNPRNPRNNILLGSAFLSLMIRKAGSDFEGLRAYNQGLSGKDASEIQRERATTYANTVLRKKKKLDIIL